MIHQLLDVASTDPEDARRRKLLNILLLGVATLAITALLATTIAVITGAAASQQEITLLYGGSVAMLVGIAIILGINRYGSGQVAGSIFLLLLTVSFVFTDEPSEVVNGRSLLMFAIPILMASVLLRPYASFIIAALSSLLIAVIALGAQLVPNPYAMLGFFALALISWLAARSLEQALTELRIINQELDERVEARTRDLAAALAREQSEASKTQAILEGIADGVIVFDNAGKAIVANPSIGRLVGRPFDEITGLDINRLMTHDVDATAQKMISDLLKSKELRHSSAKFEWGNKTLSVSFAPVLGTAGEVTGTVAVFRDFTREAEVERMKSAFVSMVSHDLRTPLGVIIGYTDMLCEAVYGPLSEKQLNVMARINANTGRLVNMVDNLLDQAQIEAGRLNLHINPFDPRQLLTDMESIMSMLTKSKGLELICHIDDNVPSSLPGDQQRLHQVLINLVNNAIKFTEQGSVSVRIHRPDEDHWAIDVSDTGPGIPAEAQDYIFEPFRQVDSSITRKYTGAGLGLSIVKQLTNLMGGEIELASEVGQGSTFTVVLPLNITQEDVS